MNSEKINGNSTIRNICNHNRSLPSYASVVVNGNATQSPTSNVIKTNSSSQASRSTSIQEKMQISPLTQETRLDGQPSPPTPPSSSVSVAQPCQPNVVPMSNGGAGGTDQNADDSRGHDMLMHFSKVYDEERELLRTTRRENQNLSQKNKELESQLASLKLVKDLQGKQLNNLLRDNQQQKTEITQLQDLNKVSAEIRKRNESECEALKKANKELEGKVNNLSGNLKKKESEIRKQGGSIKLLQSECEMLQIKKGEITKKLEMEREIREKILQEAKAHRINSTLYKLRMEDANESTSRATVVTVGQVLQEKSPKHNIPSNSSNENTLLPANQHRRNVNNGNSEDIPQAENGQNGSIGQISMKRKHDSSSMQAEDHAIPNGSHATVISSNAPALPNQVQNVIP